MAFWGEWKPYVPVAQRRAQAQREMEKLRKRGQRIYPVVLEGRTIARSFWGKGWCTHLESFSDYANRLPRGRTYVRNGSVCHLDIQAGQVEAIVSGSDLYRIAIHITPLPAATWTGLKTQCAGHIGSMLELLQGKLSDAVMARVTHRQEGLFPQPGEMQMTCSCPDWAVMCKHVAAVLYGVGSRLDTQPELLFLLRGVDAQELIIAELALPDVAATSESLADDQLGAIFGIDLDVEHAADPVAPPARVPKRTPVRKPPKAPRPAPVAVPSVLPKVKRVAAPVAVATTLPSRPTGKSIVRLRRKQGLSVAQFATQLGVSAASVYRWEATPGPLNLHARILQALAALQQPTTSHGSQATPERPPKRPRRVSG